MPSLKFGAYNSNWPHGLPDFLGLMYDLGQGVPQNYVQAHMWFSLSVALGDPVGTRNRDQAAALLTPAQLAESERLLRAWRPGPASVPSIVIGPQKAGSP